MILFRVTIKSTGANVEFNKTSAQRAIKNARQKKNNIAYPEIEKVVSGAKYSGFREADERHQNVKGQDVYHSGVVYKGVPYSVEFYVDVPLSGNTGDNFAGNKIREIKIASTETRVTSENQNRPANNLSDAISNISLAVLRGKVKPARYDTSTNTYHQTGELALDGGMNAPEMTDRQRMREKAIYSVMGQYEPAKKLITLFQGKNTIFQYEKAPGEGARKSGGNGLFLGDFLFQIGNQSVQSVRRFLDERGIFVAGGDGQADVFNDNIDNFEFAVFLFNSPDDGCRLSLFHRNDRIYKNLVGGGRRRGSLEDKFFAFEVVKTFRPSFDV